MTPIELFIAILIPVGILAFGMFQAGRLWELMKKYYDQSYKEIDELLDDAE